MDNKDEQTMPIRGILFDIGDTLLAAGRLQRAALEETVLTLTADGWGVSPAAFVSAYLRADSEPQFDDTPDLNHLYSDPRIVARAFALIPAPAGSRRAEQFLRLYRDFVRQGIGPNAAHIAAVGELRRLGVLLGVVSNGTTIEQFEQLELMALADFFDPILISQRAGIRKPDPRLPLIAVRQWRLPPKDVLLVGDRPDWDVLAARRAGMLSALTTEFVDLRDSILPDVKPDYIIGSLRELIELVKGSRNEG
jgi:putative hydrolase of the HAD superfamily